MAVNFCNIWFITLILCGLNFLPLTKMKWEWNSSRTLPWLAFWDGKIWVSLSRISHSGCSVSSAYSALCAQELLAKHHQKDAGFRNVILSSEMSWCFGDPLCLLLLNTPKCLDSLCSCSLFLVREQDARPQRAVECLNYALNWGHLS